MKKNLKENNINEKMRLFSISKVATMLGQTEDLVKHLIDEEKLRADNFKGNYVISYYAIEDYLRGKEATLPEEKEKPKAKQVKKQTNVKVGKGKKRTRPYTGTYHQRENGSFTSYINLKGSGKNRKRETKTLKSEDAIAKHLNKRLAELNATLELEPEFKPESKINNANNQIQRHNSTGDTDKTFEEYCVYILNKGVGNAKSRTIDSYRTSLASVSKLIGKEKMKHITADMLRPTFEELSQNYTDDTIKKIFNTVRMIFNEAIKNNDLSSTPFDKLVCPNSSVIEEKKRKAYTDEEVAIILREAKNYNPTLYTIFALLESTGLRPGELRALEWDRVNLKEGTIYINKASIQRYEKGYEKIETLSKQPRIIEVLSVPKTKYSKRTIPLSDLAIKTLTDWRKFLDSSSEKEKNSEFVFPSKTGSFRSESSLRSMISRFNQRELIQPIGVTFYRFRHTLCTNLALANSPIHVTKLLLGDNTLDVINRIYTDVSDEQAIEKSKSFYRNRNQKHMEKGLLSSTEQDLEEAKPLHHEMKQEHKEKGLLSSVDYF